MQYIWIIIGNNVKVLGTLEKPIGYNDLIEIAEHINYNIVSYCYDEREIDGIYEKERNNYMQ